MDPEDEPVLDVESLDKLEAVGGPSLVVRMIDLFTNLVPERLSLAREALASGDLTTLERYMHSMKSSAANIGAQRMRRHATEAERLAGEFGGEERPLRDALDGLDKDYQELAVKLAEERTRRDGQS